MTEQEIRDIAKTAMREVVSAKNGEDRMDMLEDSVKKLGNAVNELSEKFAVKKEAEGENAAFEGKETAEEEKEEKKEEKEGATLENAKPSQAMVAAFATALNVDFGAKTPSFASLASLVGIKETDAAARIAAVNTKFAELQKTAPKTEKSAGSSAMEVF